MNSPDLECDEDPAICDCAFHDNARRAAATDPVQIYREQREPPAENLERVKRLLQERPEVAARIAEQVVTGLGLGAFLDNDPPRCSQCGREPPTHARHCPTLGTFGPAAAELAEQLRAQPKLHECYDAHGNVKRCSECGNMMPLHNNGCSLAPGRAPAFKLEMHGAEGDAMCCIFNAVRAGGTLILTGPNSVISPNDRQFGATLEDDRGELSANAIGNELGDCLVGLVREWRRLEQLEQHQAEHDRALS